LILHVGHFDKKFISPFIELVRSEGWQERHEFWLVDPFDKNELEKSASVFVCPNSLWRKLAGYARLIRKLQSAEKVMLHGLFNMWVVVVLALCPWVLSKCHWVIWGGDLYQYRTATKAWRSRIKERFRRFVIRRVGHLVTYIDGDVELARQWYGANGKHHECIMYLSNVVDPEMIVGSAASSHHEGWNILLGNSADPSNNHIEALERLLPFKDESIKIYVPLSYGDQNHAKKVISQGEAWFGKKFVAMTDFVPFEQYLEFLKDVDIAIFNHKRQQAMGNTITLLSMGKTVFMRSNVSQWEFLTSLGVTLNNVNDLELCRTTIEEANGNAGIVCSYFSRENLIDQLKGVLEI
jgi:hypothetical protein